MENKKTVLHFFRYNEDLSIRKIPHRKKNSAYVEIPRKNDTHDLHDKNTRDHAIVKQTYSHHCTNTSTPSIKMKCASKY